MKLILLTVAATLLAWVVHSFLVSFYKGLIDGTGSILFRAIHGFEIGLVAFVAFVIFFSKYPDSNLLSTLFVGLMTLAIVDFILFKLKPEVWSSFDLIHIATAYITFSIGVCLARLLV